MKHVMAASLAVMLAIPPSTIAAAAPPEPAAVPFPIVVSPEPPHQTHRAAWACMITGAGLVGASFVLHDRANQRYDEYLNSSDPAEIDDLYQQTVRLDRLSGASLLTGEVLFAAGVYLRFLRTPPASRLSLALEGGTCVARWRF
jgi:hypothetical protein